MKTINGCAVLSAAFTFRRCVTYRILIPLCRGFLPTMEAKPCAFAVRRFPNLYRSRTCPFTDQLIALSDARPTDRIAVTGHNTLGIFLDLCRRGFWNAACRTGAQGPHTSDNAADSLWIVKAEHAAELRTLIVKCGRDLRPHGTLLVSVKNDSADDAALPLAAVLPKWGFQQKRHLITTGRVLLLCQRQTSASIWIAA